MPDIYTKRQEDIDLAIVSSDVKYLVKSIDEINKLLKEDYVTQKDIYWMKKIVFGLVGMVLIAVAGVIINFFIPFITR